MLDKPTLNEFYMIIKVHALDYFNREKQYASRNLFSRLRKERNKELDKDEKLQLFKILLKIYDEFIEKQNSLYELEVLWCSCFFNPIRNCIHGADELELSALKIQRKNPKVINTFIRILSRQTQDSLMEFFNNYSNLFPMPFQRIINVLKSEIREIEIKTLGLFRRKKRVSVTVPKTKEELIAEIQTLSRQ